MVKEIDPSLNEAAFLLDALRENRRTDGRETFDMRSLNLKFGSDYGYVEVQLGKTRHVEQICHSMMPCRINSCERLSNRVAARVTAKVERPHPDKATEGLLTINTEISPMASPYFESGRYGIS